LKLKAKRNILTAAHFRRISIRTKGAGKRQKTIESGTLLFTLLKTAVTKQGQPLATKYYRLVEDPPSDVAPMAPYVIQVALDTDDNAEEEASTMLTYMLIATIKLDGLLASFCSWEPIVTDLPMQIWCLFIHHQALTERMTFAGSDGHFYNADRSLHLISDWTRPLPTPVDTVDTSPSSNLPSPIRSLYKFVDLTTSDSDADAPFLTLPRDSPTFRRTKIQPKLKPVTSDKLKNEKTPAPASAGCRAKAEPSLQPATAPTTIIKIGTRREFKPHRGSNPSPCSSTTPNIGSYDSDSMEPASKKPRCSTPEPAKPDKGKAHKTRSDIPKCRKQLEREFDVDNDTTTELTLPSDTSSSATSSATSAAASKVPAPEAPKEAKTQPVDSYLRYMGRLLDNPEFNIYLRRMGARDKQYRYFVATRAIVPHGPVPHFRQFSTIDPLSIDMHGEQIHFTCLQGVYREHAIYSEFQTAARFNDWIAYPLDPTISILRTPMPAHKHRAYMTKLRQKLDDETN